MITKRPDTKIPPISPDCSAKTAKLKKELLELRDQKSKRSVSPFTPAPETIADDNRKSARYKLSTPSVCYSVLPTGEVELQSAIPAVLADASIGGVMLWVETAIPATGQEMLVGIEHSGNQLAWFGTRLIGGLKNTSGLSELNLAFGGSTNNLLQQGLIAPTLDRRKMQYRLPASEAALKSLVAVGAAYRISLDFLNVCPVCQGVPTVRSGCSVCLSAHTEKKKMIHHYACANVDFIEEFEFEVDGRTEIACKKCRCRNMIVGSDYEYLDGPNRCQECGQSNLDLADIGHCLSCSNRFSMADAHHLELIGYRVHRLDILDIIHTA